MSYNIQTRDHETAFACALLKALSEHLDIITFAPQENGSISVDGTAPHCFDVLPGAQVLHSETRAVDTTTSATLQIARYRGTVISFIFYFRHASEDTFDPIQVTASVCTSRPHGPREAKFIFWAEKHFRRQCAISLARSIQPTPTGQGTLQLAPTAC